MSSRSDSETRPDRTPRHAGGATAVEVEVEALGRLDDAASADRRRERIWRQAYAAQGREDLLELYADWAESYDDDHEAVGFAGHARAARVLARHLAPDRAPRVLDAGAGTGLAGGALAELGYRRLTGIDLSEEMLVRAREKGVYEELRVADLSWPLDAFRADAFDAAILVGVFSFGQAPASALDEVLRVVRPGGLIVFTVRADFHEQDAMGVASRMALLEQEGAWRLVERTTPELYLPRKDPEARFRVWCFEVLPGKRPEPDPDFLEAVREALTMPGPIKRIAHHHIWDATASRLYDAYIQRPEYYLNAAEEEILRENAGDFLGDRALCVELGCGSAEKISHVFRSVLGDDPEATVDYMPIDVSPGALVSTEETVRAEFGDRVSVEARLGLFDETLASIPADRAKAIFFLGGSIGNFETISETLAFLSMVRERMGAGDRFVIGFDLCKDAHVFEAAYNAGEPNRRFFLHMVRRMNDELGADFDLEGFRLGSTYDPEPSTAGMRTHLVNLKVVSQRDQPVRIPALDLDVRLRAGDAVQVGVSRKFNPDDVAALGTLAGLRVRSLWFDARHYFALAELIRDESPVS